MTPGCGEPRALPNSLFRVLRVRVKEVRETPLRLVPARVRFPAFAIRLRVGFPILGRRLVPLPLQDSPFRVSEGPLHELLEGQGSPLLGPERPLACFGPVSVQGLRGRDHLRQETRAQGAARGGAEVFIDEA